MRSNESSSTAEHSDRPPRLKSHLISRMVSSSTTRSPRSGNEVRARRQSRDCRTHVRSAGLLQRSRGEPAASGRRHAKSWSTPLDSWWPPNPLNHQPSWPARTSHLTRTVSPEATKMTARPRGRCQFSVCDREWHLVRGRFRQTRRKSRARRGSGPGIAKQSIRHLTRRNTWAAAVGVSRRPARICVVVSPVRPPELIMADHRLTNAVEVASGITESHLVSDLLDRIG